MSKEQQERILRDFAALDESRQQDLANEAARLAKEQEQSA